MFRFFTTVLLVTLLSGISSQGFYEERNTYRKSRAKPVAANIHDGQGEKVTEKDNQTK